MVRKAARVNIHIAIPSTPGQFTVTRPALAAGAHQLNIYWEREAACRAAFGAKRSAKPHWQSQLRTSEALQEESDTAPVQRKATVKRLYLPSPLLSFKNQLAGSLSRSLSPFFPPYSCLCQHPTTCVSVCRSVCLRSINRALTRSCQTPQGFPYCTASRQPSSTAASSKKSITQKKGCSTAGWIYIPTNGSGRARYKLVFNYWCSGHASTLIKCTEIMSWVAR